MGSSSYQHQELLQREVHCSPVWVIHSGENQMELLEANLKRKGEDLRNMDEEGAESGKECEEYVLGIGGEPL